MKKKLLQIYVFWRIWRNWKRVAKQINSHIYTNNASQCLVIVPCDPWSVGGSRGDEAMITGVIHRYRNKHPNISIHIVCADANGKEYINKLGMDNIHPIISWNGAYCMERVYYSILNVNPTEIIILGADCMDGFYAPDLSLNLLALHDLFSRTNNTKSCLLGFSFNEHPSWLMLLAFRSLSKDIRIRIRDKISFCRYKRFTHMPAQLVADAAFMLKPQTDFKMYKEVTDWVSFQHNNGQTIIGLNFHPMLRTYSGAEDVKGDAIILAHRMEEILQQHPTVSLVLIPHDDRSRLSDNLMLSTIFDTLHKYHSRIFYSPEVPRAPQLKALCGLLDGLISSRMHLAIAAFGMEVPVMAATYQGKFEGLFLHFNLDDTFLLNPKRFLSHEIVETFASFLQAIPDLKKQISERLPVVQQLSYKNLKDE